LKEKLFEIDFLILVKANLKINIWLMYQ